ncbi:aspartic proteinase Asp1-like isoform X1 [Tripterygium wilfordii]|uniref:aspartic proteinase Asp1-like isoform X1 n=1 Tax=Tripterygium wilfordii TaxID=458696 RepID=UPI0018F7EB1D|nr:aspartic proteinase Asp1-like isoform X1 [Tripterygium wilfordii]
MKGKTLIIPLPAVMLMMVLPFLGCLSEANHSTASIRKLAPLPSPVVYDLRGTSSIVFPLTGKIYPTWAYFATINIGEPAKLFSLVVDTASYVTWVKCVGSCKNCSRGPRPLYRPPNGSIVSCEDPLCAAVQGEERNCSNPNDRCEYVLNYADGSSTHGYLVKDNFHLPLINGSVIVSPLIFGCGYKQIGHFPRDGIIGLSMNPASLLSQIHGKSRIKRLIGHCFSRKGGGILFFGDDLVPVSGISWTPIIDNYKM